MTLLVFLTRAAGTGVIAADFGSNAHRFGSFGLGRAGLILQVLLAALLATLDLLCDGGLDRSALRGALGLSGVAGRGASGGATEAGAAAGWRGRRGGGV